MKLKKLLCIAFPMSALLCGCARESADIGIIGGADGPTAVFIASKSGSLPVAGIALALVTIAIGITLTVLKRKKR